MMKMRYDPYNPIEQNQTTQLNRQNFVKRDEMKRYTEEWLKTLNMRGKK